MEVHAHPARCVGLAGLGVSFPVDEVLDVTLGHSFVEDFLDVVPARCRGGLRLSRL
jgi:hypothetical protein